MQVLITDFVHPVLFQKLKQHSIECVTILDVSLIELKQIISKFQGIIVRTRTQITKEVIDVAPDLKFIGRIGSGMENIDVKYALSQNLTCFNSPEGNSYAVAEYTVGALLSLLRNINKGNNELHTGNWHRKENRGLELKNKTIGIIGFGNTGCVVANILSCFGCKVLVYDRYKVGFGNKFISEVEMTDFFKEVDILSLNIPFSESVRNLVCRDFIKKFTKNIVLINTSRGSIINIEDLAVLMKEKKITGAILDVFEKEGDSFNKYFLENDSLTYLLESERVIVTPHIAGHTEESEFKMAEILVGKIIKIFS